MRALAVLTVRNEGAFLLEWLAHHQAVGFTDFLILSNECDDPTAEILAHLDAQGLVHHLPNDGPHEGGVQWAGLKRADRHRVVREVDWILTLDIDEFVNIHLGQGTLADLIAAAGEATAITLTWRLFGNAGVRAFVDAPITEQFRMAAPEILHWPWRAAMFKTLYRNDGTYRKLGVHRPRSPDQARVEAAVWMDGSGRALPDRFKRKQIFSPFGRDNYGLAQLNHYPLGAMESYVLKAHRGRAVHGDDRLGMDYWVERNWNEVEDRSIERTGSARAAALAALMGDPQLARLHGQAVEWRHETFRKLMLEEPYRALMGRLLMTPSTQPMAMAAARKLYQFAQMAAENGD